MADLGFYQAQEWDVYWRLELEAGLHLNFTFLHALSIHPNLTGDVAVCPANNACCIASRKKLSPQGSEPLPQIADSFVMEAIWL